MTGKDREEFDSQRPRQLLTPAMALECLRTASATAPTPSSREEARIPLYWRIFGGTILSLVGMVVLTVFQQLYSTLSDMRSELNRLLVSREELLKRDEFHTHLSSVESNVKELQALHVVVGVLKERLNLMEQRLKDSEANRREYARKSPARINSSQASAMNRTSRGTYSPDSRDHRDPDPGSPQALTKSISMKRSAHAATTNK